VLDLDGVVWLGDDEFAGSADAVGRLRSAGHRVVFCTNNSSRRLDAYESKLEAFGIDAHGLVVSSATAAGSLLGASERVLVCAGDGAREAVEAAGASEVFDAPFDTVLVGFHQDFDYEAMRRATRAVLAGARLVATNDDPIYPSGDGPAPGAGAILASIERASGRRAIVAGKPNQPMAALIRRRFGSSGVFVGDSLDTDAAMARELRWPFALVLSGNTSASMLGPSNDSAWVAEDLRRLVDDRLSSRARGARSTARCCAAVWSPAATRPAG
jgi:4-nitrophenyl phosphatase